MMPTVLFFARDYQAKLFPLLKSDKYKSLYVVLNRREKEIVVANGGEVVICLEEEFDSLSAEGELNSYLEYSFGCDRNYVGLNLQERETILKKSISFWRNILEKYEPSLIINETVAIELSEVLAIEAKAKGIKYLSWMSFPKQGTFYWQKSPYHNSMEPTLEAIVPSETELKEATSFVQGLRDGLERPFYVKAKSTRYSFLKFSKNIWTAMLEISLMAKVPKLKRRVAYGARLNTSLWNIKLFLLSLFTFTNKYDNIADSKGRELIFYPLHFEPEAVLFYMAYFFDNQVSVIESTLKCLSQNQILVVKEHPQQTGVLLEKRFRHIKKRYPNLIFIRGEEPTTEILGKCSVIITLGSTAGFEALSLGKKVINLGRVFYDAFDGVNNCKSFKEVYDLLRGVVPFNTSSTFDYFVAKMLNYIKPGNPFPHGEVYSAENVAAIKNAIEDELIRQDK